MHPWILALLLLLLVPASALALDCTPDFNWTCTTNGFFNYLSGQPGEVICGVDHTGWTLNVVSVTLTTGGWVHFAAAAASGGPGTGVANAIYLMDDCGTGTCTDSAQSSGVADLVVCLEPRHPHLCRRHGHDRAGRHHQHGNAMPDLRAGGHIRPGSPAPPAARCPSSARAGAP
jgi:hypothetical protein